MKTLRKWLIGASTFWAMCAVAWVILDSPDGRVMAGPMSIGFLSIVAALLSIALNDSPEGRVKGTL